MNDQSSANNDSSRTPTSNVTVVKRLQDLELRARKSVMQWTERLFGPPPAPRAQEIRMGFADVLANVTFKLSIPLFISYGFYYCYLTFIDKSVSVAVILNLLCIAVLIMGGGPILIYRWKTPYIASLWNVIVGGASVLIYIGITGDPGAFILLIANLACPALIFHERFVLSVFAAEIIVVTIIVVLHDASLIISVYIGVLIATSFILAAFVAAGRGFRKVINEYAETIEARNRESIEHAKREVLAAQAEERAVLEERTRLAQEIHDGLGHHLTAINLQLRGALAMWETNGPRARAAVVDARQATSAALIDVRRSLTSLSNEPKASCDLMLRLQTLCDLSNRVELTTGIESKGEPYLLDPSIVEACYRVIQEGITNAWKHAQATLLSITVDFEDPEYLRLTILDNGRGCTDLHEGKGLQGMRRRVRRLGGTMSVEATPQGGFKIAIQIPR